jgi:hypothetical protein
MMASILRLGAEVRHSRYTPTMSNRIPAYSGPRIIEMCDHVSVRRYLDAPNEKIVRKPKTGQIMLVACRRYRTTRLENHSPAGGP